MTPQNSAFDQTHLMVSTDQSRLNMKLIVDFLSQTYWGKDSARERKEKAIKHSFCFGLYHDENQIGFARVVTDYTFFAWLADVFVLPQYQRGGYGQFLMAHILNHPLLVDIKRWRLATSDAHDFYSKFGFTMSQHPEHLMERTGSVN